MKRDRLKKLARDKRFIPGIYNYCDRWCERCPQTAHCLNFTISEEDSSDPESRDIRNEAFWKKLSGIFEETLELLKESAKEWGVDLDTLDSADDMEKMKAREEAAENHLLCRAARKYAEMVKEWVDEKETLFFETAAAARDGVDLDEAVEVIQWYQYFIAAKIMRAVRGRVDEEEERDDEFPSDSDGSAKIALIAMDRSIAAWAMIRHYDTRGAEKVIDLITFLDGVRQAVEKTFPKARSFVRPGFESFDLNG
jgi:hypothetical protein